MGCAHGKQSREDTGGGVEEKGRHRRSRRPVITLKMKKLQKHLFKKISTYAKCRERLGPVEDRKYMYLYRRNCTQGTQLLRNPCP